MIRILNITEEGRGGGALYRIRLMAKFLSKDIETIVLCPSNAIQFQEKLSSDKTRYETIRLHTMSKSLTGALFYCVSFIPEVVAIVRVIKKLKPEIIHVNGSWQIKGVLAGMFVKTPVLWHMNDTLQPLLVRFLFRILKGIPEAFIYASNATKSYYSSLVSSSRCIQMETVIPAPVNTSAIRFKKRINLRKKPLRALMIGYINKNKGIELLLQAAGSFKNENVLIDIVGPVLDSQESYMKVLLDIKKDVGAKNINFIGYKDISNEFLHDYDFYICSSLHESSPTAVWEAMASGLPIVSTDVGDVGEMVKKYKCGLITKNISGTSLGASIQEMINVTNERYGLMSKGARLCAEESFDAKIVAKSYLRFYTEIVSEFTD